MSDIPADAPPQTFRERLRVWVESPRFRYTILGIIAINSVTIGLETSPTVMGAVGDELHALDKFILGIFVVELAIRIYAHGLRFFRDPWGVFDFVIVAISLVPASDTFSVFRALRVLRAMRLVSGVPRLRRVVGALLGAVPGIGAVAALLTLVFYVFAVIGTKLFGGSFPQWFGTIGESMYSLFQIMTLESWSMGIVRPIMEVHPLAWTFFVPFIVISSFTVLNLFIAIIVDSMQTIHEAEADEVIDEVAKVVYAEGDVLAAEIATMRAEVRELKSLIERNGR
ncbi:MAG: ion transporter [Alphaproteobacteria bacterium]|nr:ion transporter [Alphaproteobacteria bacterium]